MEISKVVKLVIALAVSQLAGVIGSLFTYPALPTWYANLNMPLLTPPNWVFAPVWITLFFLMGIAAYLVWDKETTGFLIFKWKNRKVRIALYIFAVQLVLNVLWSFLFFGLHLQLIAFIEIVVLWFAILATLLKFYEIDKRASLLLVPYLLWVCFAGNLNLMFVLLNI